MLRSKREQFSLEIFICCIGKKTFVLRTLDLSLKLLILLFSTAGDVCPGFQWQGWSTCLYALSPAQNIRLQCDTCWPPAWHTIQFSTFKQPWKTSKIRCNWIFPKSILKNLQNQQNMKTKIFWYYLLCKKPALYLSAMKAHVTENTVKVTLIYGSEISQILWIRWILLNLGKTPTVTHVSKSIALCTIFRTPACNKPFLTCT